MTTATADPTATTTPTGTDPVTSPSATDPALLGAADPAPADPAATPDPTAKPADPKPAEPAEVKYEFKAPDGVEFDQPHLEKFTALAKELNLKPEDAQKAVDLVSAMELERVQQHAETVKGWVASVKADPVLGGDKLGENLAVAKKTFDLLPAEQATELKGLLNQTGLEAHPVFFRLFHAVGKALSEDKFVPSGKRPAAAGDASTRLYPTTANTPA